jgi:chemotaxis signal transduction protein
MTDLFYFKSRDHYGALPIDRVLRILPKMVVFKLPFSTGPLAGLVPFDGTLAPLVMLSDDGDQPADAGGYFLLIRTQKGQILFRVDAVSGSRFPSAEGRLLTEHEIEALAADFSEAAAGRDAIPAPLATEAPDSDIAFLIVEAAGTLIAIPATAVARVDRHRQSKPMRGFEACERLVTLSGPGATGTLMAGFSLGHWLDRTVAPEAEPWALVVDSPSHPFAVTVPAIHGLVTASGRAIHAVPHRQGTSFWYLDPAQGPIEILEPTAFGGPPGSGPGLANRLPPPPAPTGTRSKDTRERRHGLQARRGLAARVGGYYCVFPATSIVEIVATVNPADVAGRQAGDCPVLDLSVLLGLPAREEPGRALVVARRGRRTLMVLADDVGTIPLETVWHPLPPVPAGIRHLFEAIGYDGKRLYFLVREEALGSRPTRSVAALAKRSFVGFMGRPGPQASIRGFAPSPPPGP